MQLYRGFCVQQGPCIMFSPRFRAVLNRLQGLVFRLRSVDCRPRYLSVGIFPPILTVCEHVANLTFALLKFDHVSGHDT